MSPAIGVETNVTGSAKLLQLVLPLLLQVQVAIYNYLAYLIAYSHDALTNYATADQTYYYFVQVASSIDGAHASGLSAAVRGLRSGAVSIPKGLKTTTTPGKIFLSWEPNPQNEDLVHYRVYGGTEPEALTLIDSVRADSDPRAVIRDIVPLPKEFNVADMGLDINADRAAIRAYLADAEDSKIVIPYRENRAVIFASRLFHGSDAVSFALGFENHRINVTLLFGASGPDL